MREFQKESNFSFYLAMFGTGLSLILSGSVLFGWFTHNTVLIQISESFVPMQFNTALGFLFCGIGLTLIIIKKPFLSQIVGGGVIILAGSTLSQYLFGIDLKIDQLFMQHYITTETSHPGRMAPNTALCFLMSGFAIILLSNKYKNINLFSAALGSLVFGLALVALTGYSLSLEAAYGWGALTRMAIHTASGFIIVGSTIISLAWHQSTNSQSRLPSWLPIPVGIGSIMIVISLWNAFESAELKNIPTNLLVTMLLVGLIFSITLTLAIYFAQRAVKQTSELKISNKEKVVLERQFQHIQKQESLGQLSGGIAHDFNNILAIIIGYCELTKMNLETAKVNILVIEKAAERGAGLCRQMLTYAGKSPLTMTKINMVMQVNETVSMLKKSLPKNVVIKTEVSGPPPMIKGDVSQLQQVVMNLIINASEAIGIEQGEVNVSLTKFEVIAGKTLEDYNGQPIASGEYVCLEIIDNGCGMDKVTKEKIFEPFYTTKFTGRGLGMSAVIGIIKSHAGALQLFSQLGHGTTFKVYLPALVNELNRDKDKSSSTTSVSWQGSGTILLVEDEELLRSLAKEWLEMFGFTVLEAVNGKEALDIYKNNSAEITLVFTDIAMPVMNGYELFEKLKNLKPELPIIISSGYGDAEVSTRIGSDNIARIISKPYNSDKLRKVLKGVLSR